MKFEIGDKVVILKMQYFDNSYHYDKCIEEFTVKDANEKYFSPHREKLDPFLSGSNMYSIVFQKDGRAMYGGQIYYHKEKDRKKIEEIIQTAINDFDEQMQKIDNSRIEELNKIIDNYKKEIKDSKKEIDEIKNGNGTRYFGFKRIYHNEWKEKVISEMNKIINFKEQT
jgi:hypothetical protein